MENRREAVSVDGIFETFKRKSTIRHDDCEHAVPARVGEIMYVDVVSSREKARAAFIGSRKKEYFIIEIPTVEDRVLNVSNNDRMIIRYICDGKLYGFQSHVILKIGQPLNLVFLTYPSFFEEVSLRRSPRVILVTPIERESGDIRLEHTINISGVGALLSLNNALDPENPIVISFNLPDGKRVENMPCRIVRQEEHGSAYHTAVEFDLKHEAIKDIERHVRRVVHAQGDFASA